MLVTPLNGRPLLNASMGQKGPLRHDRGRQRPLTIKVSRRRRGAKEAATLGLIFMAALTAEQSRADVLDVANALRANGCEPAVRAPLQREKRLDRAAQALARGTSLRDAADRAGYRSTALASIHLGGYRRDEDLRAVLRSRYCPTLTKPELRDIGVAKRGNEVWLILGAELNVPDDPQAVARRVLELVNRARTQPRRCGSQAFAATGSLSLNDRLNAAALTHARDMARHSYLEHRGRDGSTPAQRVSATGYVWRHAGENIAAGPGSAEDAVQGWLDSPGHCANIMNAQFTQMGVAYAQSRDDYGIYWTQMFATPR